MRPAVLVTDARNPPIEQTTIIVATYNRQIYLKDALDSLLSQTRPAKQIIVVDDGSTDDTRRLVAQYGDLVDYFYQDNAGKAMALNLALNHVEGDTIWIFDDDDIAHPQALERLSNALNAAPSAGFAFGQFDCFAVDKRGRSRVLGKPFVVQDTDDLFFAALLRCIIFQPSMLVRRRCYEHIGLFRVELYRIQDYDMLLRLTRDYCGIHVPHIVFHQRNHGGLRGPAHLRLSGRELNELSTSLFQGVMSRIRSDTSLEQYLPRRGGFDLGRPHHYLTAVHRRAAAMMRAACWGEALKDICEAAEFATEYGLPIDTEIENNFSIASNQPLLWERPEFWAFLRAVNSVGNSVLRSRIHSGTLWPLLRESLKNLFRFRFRAGWCLLILYLKGGCWRTIFRHLHRMISGHFGLTLNRNHRILIRANNTHPLLSPATDASV